MKAKKTAFFVTALDSGGLENYLLRFLTHYQNEIEATVYCKAGYVGSLETEYKKIGVSIKPFKMGHFDTKSFKKLKAELIANQYDSVCDFTGNFAGIVLYISKKAGIHKRVVFYRGSDNHFKEDYFRLAYNYMVKQLVKKYATNILSNSVTALDFFYADRNKDNQKYEVIYNGIDSEKFLTTNTNLRSELNIPETAFTVGHVGRYNAAKNHKTIIEVAVQLCQKYSDIYFIMCGDKVDENLKERVASENMEAKIKLLGNRKDVVKVLNSMDCFYFPSISEGQPNALIEALITGLPFVASDINPIKETIPAEFHEQLVPPLSVDRAIEAILKIYHDEKTISLKDWAIEYYNPSFWFKKFYEKL